MRIHPGGFRLVLAGPKVARLLPFLQQKGFVAEAFIKGSDALNRMRQAPCHLLLLELECTDTMGIDLARGARQEGICGATLLVDDPMKSGMIISALARGVDGYVAIPPDEAIFFSRIETMLLAQWGLVVTQQQTQLTDEITRLQGSVADAEAAKVAGERRLKERITELEKQLANEKKRVGDLNREADVLREQLATMHLVTGAKSGHSDEGGPESVDFLLDDPPPKKSTPPKPAPTKPPPPAKATTPPKPKPPPADFDLDDLATSIAAAPPKPAPMAFDSLQDEATQDIPANVVASLVGSLAPSTPSKPKPSAPATRPDAPATKPELAHFDPGGGEDLEFEATMAIPASAARAAVGAVGSKKPAPAMVDDVHTMAMPADLARSLVAGAMGPVDDARTMAMSADAARAAVAAARGTPPPRGARANDGLDGPTLAGLSDLSMQHTDDFAAPPLDDFPTAAVGVPGKANLFDEPTPAAGFKGPPVPSANAGAAKGRPKPASLDSQVARELAAIPSLDNEEILFIEDD